MLLPLAVVDGARTVFFVVAIGVFLSAPPALPWVIALVASTNVAVLVARTGISRARPPLVLLLLNGATVLLVIAYAAVLR